jgi:hypothetical protein
MRPTVGSDVAEIPKRVTAAPADAIFRNWRREFVIVNTLQIVYRIELRVCLDSVPAGTNFWARFAITSAK